MDARIDPGNQEQADAWNGDEGRNWAAMADHYEASMAAYLPVLVDAARIGTDDHVLDVGCGNGGSTCAAALVASDGHATGLDLSGPMITEARLRAAARNVTNVTFVQGDAQVHPLAAGAFDVAISKFGAMFFADPVAAFSNVARALREDGRLALVAWRPLEENEWTRTLRTALEAGRDLPMPPAGAPGPFGLADPERTRELLSAAGFVDIALDARDEPFVAGTSLDDAMEFVSRSNIAKGLLADLDADAREQALATLRAALAQHESPAGVILGSAAWAITARRPA